MNWEYKSDMNFYWGRFDNISIIRLKANSQWGFTYTYFPRDSPIGPMCPLGKRYLTVELWPESKLLL